MTLGVGIGFLPVKAAQEKAVDQGKLWSLLPQDAEPSYDIYLIARDAHVARHGGTTVHG